MKSGFLKVISLLLALSLSFGVLSGCSKEEDVNVDAIVNAAVDAALEKTVVPFTVTIDADGKQISFEDVEATQIQQLLDQAKITLNEDDIIAIDPDQSVGGNMVFRVLRACHVSITVAGDKPAQDVTFHTVLVDATVADAIEAVGLKLAKNQTVNYALEDALVDDMAILITTKAEEKKVEKTEPTEPKTTEATEPVVEEEESEDDWSEDDWSEDDWSEDDWSEDDWYEEDWSDDDWYEEDWSDDDWSEPETTPPATEPPATEPPATEAPAGPYVVSEEVYLDCDGSGHGVKVITYSDGTQEEVYF